MSTTRLFGASLLLTVGATCQVNAFVFYPQDPERQTITCTSFVGRPDWNNQAEALMEVSTEHFRSVGDANGPMFVFGLYHWIADENLSTVETYSVVVRKGLGIGAGPDMAATAELLRINGLSTPPSTDPARGTWITYEGFGVQAPLTTMPDTGGTLLPSEGRYYVGVDLPANPLWPATDGHALFRADLNSAGTSALVGENERLGAPDPTWGGSVGGTGFSTPWSYILGPLVTSPNLHVGGIDPTSNRLGAAGASLGMNGLYPDIMGTPRCDGLMFRITDSLAPNGIAWMGAQFGFQPPFFLWAFQGDLIGHCHLGSQAVPLGVDALNTGSLEYMIALPNTIPPVLIGTDAVFQGIVWDSTVNLAEWTNAQAVHL